jgi:hypothetical protein
VRRVQEAAGIPESAVHFESVPGVNTMRMSKRDFLKYLGVTATVATPISKWGPCPSDAVADVAPSAIAPVLTSAPAPHSIPLLPAYVEAIDDILYDRIVFPRGAALPVHLAMFSTPIGSTCPYTNAVKGFEHTNMWCAQMLSAPQAFWIRRIHVSVNPDIAPEDARTARECEWKLYLGQKYYAGGPFATDMQRRSLRELLTGKRPAIRASLQFDAMKGLYIPPLHSCYVSVTTGTRNVSPLVSPTGNGIEFMISMEGVRWRAVA